KAFGQLLTQLDPPGRLGDAEGLGVGIHADELHTLESSLNHAVDGIAAATAHTDDLDRCILSASAIRPQHQGVPPPSTGSSPPSHLARAYSTASRNFPPAGTCFSRRKPRCHLFGALGTALPLPGGARDRVH